MFIESLVHFIKIISSGCEFDEWYLSNFIDESVYTLSQSDAFEMSSYLVEVIKKDLESSHMYELLTILLALQSQSDTTQSPINLSRDPSFLNEIIKNNGCVKSKRESLAGTGFEVEGLVESLVKLYKC